MVFINPLGNSKIAECMEQNKYVKDRPMEEGKVKSEDLLMVKSVLIEKTLAEKFKHKSLHAVTERR